MYQSARYGEQGIEVSKEEMLDYLLRSAKKGYSPALVKYAYYLENGIYVEKDYQMAYEYYLLACQKQNREGFYHLGRWFFYGKDKKKISIKQCNIINKLVIIIIQKQALC